MLTEIAAKLHQYNVGQLTYPGRVSFAHATPRDIHKRFSDDRSTCKTAPFVDVTMSLPGISNWRLDSMSLDTADCQHMFPPYTAGSDIALPGPADGLHSPPEHLLC